ncbi:MAG: hypothetical protein AB8F95_22580 [Bacteroidia bacterium]
MNLNELKILWDSQDAAVQQDRVSRDEVLSLLKGRSRTALGRINRNILLEMAVVALFGVLWIYMLISSPTAPSPLEIGSAFAYVILSAIFYRWKFKSLNAAVFEGKNLKTALQHTVRVMERFMKIYSWAVWILAPLSIPIGFLYGLQHDGLEVGNFPMRAWVIMGVFFVVFSLISVVFIKWYLRKLYGQHYDALKAALAELEEVE